MLICPEGVDLWSCLAKPLPPTWTFVCFGGQPKAIEESARVLFVDDEEQLRNCLEAETADICFAAQSAGAQAGPNALEFISGSLMNIFKAHR